MTTTTNDAEAGTTAGTAHTAPEPVPLGPQTGTPALEWIVVAAVVAVAAVTLYRKYFGKRRSPCSDCTSAPTCGARAKINERDSCPTPERRRQANG